MTIGINARSMGVLVIRLIVVGGGLIRRLIRERVKIVRDINIKEDTKKGHVLWMVGSTIPITIVIAGRNSKTIVMTAI